MDKKTPRLYARYFDEMVFVSQPHEVYSIFWTPHKNRLTYFLAWSILAT